MELQPKIHESWRFNVLTNINVDLRVAHTHQLTILSIFVCCRRSGHDPTHKTPTRATMTELLPTAALVQTRR